VSVASAAIMLNVFTFNMKDGYSPDGPRAFSTNTVKTEDAALKVWEQHNILDL
jgi:hypothetical protein